MRRPFRLAMPFIAAALACSSKTNQDLSYLQLSASAQSAPADGVTQVTLSIYAVGSDGVTPYNGQVELSSSKGVLFGGQTTPGSADTVMAVAGHATDTVLCNAGANCIGSTTIHGSLIGGSASATATLSITFIGQGGGSTSGSTSSGSGGTTGSGSGGTGGSGSATGSSATGGTTGTPDAGPPAPGGITFKQLTNKYMGIDYQTNYVKFPVNTFIFEVTDSSGKIAVPGASVNVALSTTAPGVGYLVGDVDGGGEGELLPVTSDANGLVTVQAHSGQKAGTVTLTASVVGTSYNAQASSAVIGTQPSLARSTFACGPVNLPVYAEGISGLPCETTASGSPFQTTCTANLADRFGQVVEVPVTVQFYTEAGNFVSASATTPDFGQTGTGLVPGEATNVLQTSSNVPQDVSPLAAEPSYTDPDPSNQRCGNRTYNPRDGLVSVIAVFQGEEPFTDLTGSGVYEPGDPFTDVPQPFVDSNDNSVYDPGEICPGSSVANQCGGANGVWDANTSLHAETRILYSGVGVGVPTSVLAQGSTISFEAPGPQQAFMLSESQSENGSVTWGDVNLNVAAATGTNQAYGVVVSSGPTSTTATFPAPGSKAAPPDTLGMTVTFLTDCDAGVVPVDGGSVPTSICRLVTQVSQFSGGFTSQYKVTNGNTQAGKGGPFTLTATQQILSDNASNDLTGNVSQ